MLNKNQERELAYVVKVDEVHPLEGYDRVEGAVIGGWHCIVPKGQFSAGSLGVYFEIDSLVPSDNPAFAFMEKRKYRVKTQKMSKTISQGLLMSFEDLGLDANEFKEGDFLTEKLGVKYYEVEDNVRMAKSDPNAKYKSMAGRHPKLFKNPIIKNIYKTKLGKKILYIFFGKKKDTRAEWPINVVKTDEERIQNIPYILKDKSEWIVTEKIDGTSTTFHLIKDKKKRNFYVCSRNVVQSTPNKQCYYDENVYWEMAKKYNIEFILNKLMDDYDLDWVTLQGETYGEGIQKRNYGLKGHDFMAFNLIFSDRGRLNSVEMKEILTEMNIPSVPIIDVNFILPDTVDELLDYATGKSTLDNELREGFVFRSKDGVRSFKAVSNEFLMKYHG